MRTLVSIILLLGFCLAAASELEARQLAGYVDDDVAGLTIGGGALAVDSNHPGTSFDGGTFLGDDPSLSSGSPVFGRDQGNEIVGLHHLGGLGNPCRNYSTHMDDICDSAGSLLNCS